MKKLIIVLIGLYTFGCSSPGEVKENSNSEYNEPTPNKAMAEPKEIVEPKQASVPEGVPDEKVAAVSIPVSMYTALNDGIKNQNDEIIQKTSTEILTQNSKDIKALNALAIVYYKKGRLEAAQFLLAKGIAAHPSSSELHSNLGLVYLAKNERRDATKAFRKALELNSNDTVAGANLGAIYSQEKDYFKAALSLENTIKKGTKDPKILNNYAIALSATGRAKEGAEYYEKVLKDNPSHREAMLNYAISLIENLQKNKEGLDLLNRLKFVGAPQDAREIIKNLENKAKAGLK